MSGPEPRNLGAYLCGTIAALSPFDVAIPRAGWTDLFLRPLWALTALCAALALVAGRSQIDHRLFGAVSVLVASLFVASAISDDPTVGYAVAVRLAVVFALFLAASASFGSGANLRWLMTALAAGAVAASVVGIAVYLAGGEIWLTEYFLGSISATNEVQRLTRPFSQANVAAMYLAPVAAILVVFAITASSHLDRRLTALFLGAGSIAALAVSLTFSRSGNIALGAALCGFVLLSRSESRLRLLPLFVVLGLAGLRVVGPGWSERVSALPASVGRRPLARRDIWSQALDAFTDQPVAGVGTGQFGAFSSAHTPEGFAAAPHAHSVPLELLATGGLLVAIPLLALVLLLTKILADGYRHVPVPLLVGVAAVAIHMNVDYPLVFSSSGNLVAVVLGASAAHALGARPTLGAIG